jgi:hypothetical protein
MYESNEQEKDGYIDRCTGLHYVQYDYGAAAWEWSRSVPFVSEKSHRDCRKPIEDNKHRV